MGFSNRWVISALLLQLVAVGCGGDDTAPDSGDDTGTEDADVGGGSDTGTDTGAPDTGTEDTGAPDMGPMGCTEGCAIEEIGVGGDYACARRENGEILCWGGNLNGQLGDNRMRHAACGMLGVEVRDCSAMPVSVGPEVFESLTAGSAGACAIEAPVGGDNTLYCWGLTDLPPAGLDARQRDFRPEVQDGFPTISIADRGSINTCGIDASGGVVCRGENESGQLGNGEFMESVTAVSVSDLTGIVEVGVAIGGEFACGRDSDTVYCWGNNAAGQLGDDATHEVCGIDEDVYDCSSAPVEVTIDGSMVESISVGGSHACALMADGSVLCWGANFAGQTGTDTEGADVAVPTAVPDVAGATQVVAGGQHTCALLAGGDVKCWGRNDEGQLGDGSLDHGSCTSSGDSFDCSADAVDVTFAGEFTVLAAGGQNTCGIDGDGEVQCWGWNDQRQLGPEGSEARERSAVPVRIAGLE